MTGHLGKALSVLLVSAGMGLAGWLQPGEVPTFPEPTPVLDTTNAKVSIQPLQRMPMPPAKGLEPQTSPRLWIHPQGGAYAAELPRQVGGLLVWREGDAEAIDLGSFVGNLTWTADGLTYLATTGVLEGTTLLMQYRWGELAATSLGEGDGPQPLNPPTAPGVAGDLFSPTGEHYLTSRNGLPALATPGEDQLIYLTELVSEYPQVERITWSPDGQRLALQLATEQPRRAVMVVAIEITAEGPIELLRVAGTLPTLSNDELYFVSTGQLFAYSFASETMEQLTELHQWRGPAVLDPKTQRLFLPIDQPVQGELPPFIDLFVREKNALWESTEPGAQPVVVTPPPKELTPIQFDPSELGLSPKR